MYLWLLICNRFFLKIYPWKTSPIGRLLSVFLDGYIQVRNKVFTIIFSVKSLKIRITLKYFILKKYLPPSENVAISPIMLCGPYCMNLYSKRRWQRWHHGRRQSSQQPVGGEEVAHSPTPKWGIRRSRWAKQLWMYVLNSWPPTCYFTHSFDVPCLVVLRYFIFVSVCFFQLDNFWLIHTYVCHACWHVFHSFCLGAINFLDIIVQCLLLMPLQGSSSQTFF